MVWICQNKQQEDIISSPDQNIVDHTNLGCCRAKAIKFENQPTKYKKIIAWMVVVRIILGLVDALLFFLYSE